MNDEPARILITRDSLRDGSLIDAARRRMGPGTPVRTDQQIETMLDQMLAEHPEDHDVWLFAYGSLMWNPAMHYAERRAGTVHGWHRAYCLWLESGRGTPENPGLMLALDRGGAVSGALLRVPADQARAELLLPFRRELFTYSYDVRWVAAKTKAGPVRAMTFVVNRTGPRYAGRLDPDRIARHIATARGNLGTSQEYLDHTRAALLELGLDDRMLREVQKRTARFAADDPGQGGA